MRDMFACVHLRVKKMNEFSDRRVTWLECKSGCGGLLVSISSTQIVYQRDWKEAVRWMLWADIAWLRLPCVVADVSEAILFTCQHITTCVVVHFSDISPSVFHYLWKKKSWIMCHDWCAPFCGLRKIKHHHQHHRLPSLQYLDVLDVKFHETDINLTAQKVAS